MEANHGWVTGSALDPPTSALKAARAVLVDPREFRALDENARLLRPLVVWELKSRSARDGKQCRNWRLGARLGPDASGIDPQTASHLDATPPRIRKAGCREEMEGIRCLGQAGYLPSVATVAQSGFSAMAYLSAEVPFDRYGGDGHVLVRLMESCSRAHQGGQKGGMTQRAKVGNCARCARRTHVAAPPRHLAVDYSGHGAHRIQVWRGDGPMGRSLFSCCGLCARIRLLVLHDGVGCSVPGAEASRVAWRLFRR